MSKTTTKYAVDWYVRRKWMRSPRLEYSLTKAENRSVYLNCPFRIVEVVTTERVVKEGQ